VSNPAKVFSMNEVTINALRARLLCVAATEPDHAGNR
jgi:hypothetical protein